LGLTFLGLEPFLLSLYPCQFGADSQPHGFIIDAKGCSNPDPTIGWIHSQMQILDVLTDNIHNQAGNRNPVHSLICILPLIPYQIKDLVSELVIFQDILDGIADSPGFEYVLFPVSLFV